MVLKGVPGFVDGRQGVVFLDGKHGTGINFHNESTESLNFN